jgi:MFS family permease
VLLGGALTSALSWSWIFFINVPVGLLVMALSPVLLRESRADSATGTSTSPAPRRSPAG